MAPPWIPFVIKQRDRRWRIVAHDEPTAREIAEALTQARLAYGRGYAVVEEIPRAIAAARGISATVRPGGLWTDGGVWGAACDVIIPHRPLRWGFTETMMHGWLRTFYEPGGEAYAPSIAAWIAFAAETCGLMRKPFKQRKQERGAA